jgi:hypothetical protein
MMEDKRMYLIINSQIKLNNVYTFMHYMNWYYQGITTKRSLARHAVWRKRKHADLYRKLMERIHLCDRKGDGYTISQLIKINKLAMQMREGLIDAKDVLWC